MTITDDRAEELAQAGYEAYGDQVGWVTYRGRTMPSWGALPQPQHDAWVTAARAIAEQAQPSRTKKG